MKWTDTLCFDVGFALACEVDRVLAVVRSLAIQFSVDEVVLSEGVKVSEERRSGCQVRERLNVI